ncbi:cysteine desulfurase family protein [Exiguobacterium oxidotolerans]|uniref:Cysteine desulfurase IscS n=1 Tax=Exiguobacterium oxidotolerans TaxID=223958 RepID=A0A653IHV9_9BACL|nr:cysteine desulfurase family protein [Exiguobacterium oxidotolerans]VWX38619.1 Cysteine desulfurase IscS [Exiguobacterium oxidotolerans]
MLYLDNSATTPTHQEVVDAMLPYWTDVFGNPSSKYYSQAVDAKIAVNQARQSVAELVNVKADEVIFTSGATESNNFLLKGIAAAHSSRGNQIISSVAEHPSVLETLRYLETQGFDVIYLSVDLYGRIDLKDLERALLKKPTVLVTLLWGNNELGSLNPIKEASELANQYGSFFHTDATQVIGKVNVDLEKLPYVQFLSASAHKFYGPKGIGAAIVRKDDMGLSLKVTPLLHGGAQENGYRSGTHAVPLIVGMGKAAEIAYSRLGEHIKQLVKLEDRLSKLLMKQFGDVIHFNNDKQNKIPGILSVQFKGLNNEVLCKELAPVMAVSTGSACSSSKPSHVLQEIGCSMEQLRSTIRFSLSPYQSETDLDIFLDL